jgi:glutamyl-tRNA reductase
MASAAVELAKKIFGGLDGRTVLLVGAGKMSALTAKHLSEGTSKILVTNRTYERGRDLALQVGGIAHPWEKLHDLLAEADIVVSSTAAQRPVLTVQMIHSVIKQRHYRPLFLVDLAVPRDVEPGVDKLENVYAYDVDDLEHVVQEGRSSREAEAKKAEAIVKQEVERFVKLKAERDAVPVLAQLRTHAEEIARLEMEKTLSNFGEELTQKQRKSIEAMGKAIVNKLLHGTTVRLREAGKAGPEHAREFASLVAELFDLSETETPNPSAARPNGAARGNGAVEPEKKAPQSSGEPVSEGEADQGKELEQP